MNPVKRGRMAYSLICLVCVIVVLLSAASKTYGCSGIYMRKPCGEFGRASATFIGRAISGRGRVADRHDKNGRPTSYLRGKVRFAVQEVFSGIEGQKEIEIDSGTNSNCGYRWFQPGKTYLVYAYREPGIGYTTSICTRTSSLADATEDLNFLRSLPPKGSGVEIFGKVEAQPGSRSETREMKKGLAGIKVTAKDSRGRMVETLTDDHGNYRFKNLKPDAYTIAPALPEYYEAESAETDRLTDRRCAEENFGANIDGQVSGVVVDQDNRPVYLVTADLVAVDETGNPGSIHRLEYTDKQGRFNIKRVPPGRYRLGAGFTGGLGRDSPHLPAWHPGVVDRAQATIIELGRAEKLSGYTIKLPRRSPPN